jgi:hypothetical protein
MNLWQKVAHTQHQNITAKVVIILAVKNTTGKNT